MTHATATAHRTATTAPETTIHPSQARDTFAPVPGWLLRRPEVSQGAKLAYGRLLQYAGRDATAFPKLATLAAELGVSEDTAGRYVRELRTHGLIAVRRRGLTKSNVYRFLPHVWMKQTPPESTRRNRRDVPPPEPEKAPEIDDGAADEPGMEPDTEADGPGGVAGSCSGETADSRTGENAGSIPLIEKGKREVKKPAPTPTAVLSHPKQEPEAPSPAKAPGASGHPNPAPSHSPAEPASGPATEGATTTPAPTPAEPSTPETPSPDPSEAPAPSPIPLQSRKPSAPAEAGPLSKLNDLCAEIEAKARQTPGKRFNARAFVQAGLRAGKHPGAIEAALIQVSKAWTYIENPWPYANRILDIQSGNFHARDFERSANALKAEIDAAVDPAVIRLASHVGIVPGRR